MCVCVCVPGGNVKSEGERQSNYLSNLLALFFTDMELYVMLETVVKNAIRRRQ